MLELNHWGAVYRDLHAVNERGQHRHERLYLGLSLKGFVVSRCERGYLKALVSEGRPTRLNTLGLLAIGRIRPSDVKEEIKDDGLY